MTPAEVLWFKIQRRAGDLSSDLRPLLLRAYQRITLSYSEAEIARYIATAQIDRILDQALNEAKLDAAFSQVRERLRQGVSDTANHFIKYDIPRPRILGDITFAFDTLSPYVISGITQLESKAVQKWKDDIREVVRAHIENGIRDGVNPRVTARTIRDILPLSPKQLQAVENYRKELESGRIGAALDRALRDGRMAKLPELHPDMSPAAREAALAARREAYQRVRERLTPERIDKAVDAYRRKMISFNAETNARTAALDAQKLGQKLSWEQAIELGVVDRSRMRKKWVGVMDERERAEHIRMEAETVHFDQRYSNGEMIPGESTYNCRCVSHYFQSTLAR